MEFNTFITIFVVLSLSYMIGSFPSSIFVSKVFYKVDIRNYGSGNAGGTNVGRVLGKKAGITVMAMDILKMVIAVYATFFFVNYIDVIRENIYSFNFLNKEHYIFYPCLSALGVTIGHSYTMFADFKGGKAFASFAGFILCTNYILLLVGLITFFVTLKLKKIVSLSSIMTATIASFVTIVLCIFTYLIPNISTYLGGIYFSKNNYFAPDLIYTITVVFLAAFLIFRHRANIVRLIKHTEPVTRFKK